MKSLSIFPFISFSVLLTMAQQSKIDSLENLLKTAKEDTNKVNILYQLSEECNEEDILKYAMPALQLAEKLNYKKGMANACNNIGYAYGNQMNSSKALEYFKKSLVIQEEIGDKEKIALSFNNIAEVYNNRGDITEALEYHQKSLDIYEALGNKYGIARSFNNIGAIYRNLGDNSIALDYYKRSLAIREELGNKQDLAIILGNIGELYNAQGLPVMALEYYQKSLKSSEEIRDSIGINITLNNMGVIYDLQGNYPLALESYQKSQSICEYIGDTSGIAYSLHNIAGIYKNEGDTAKALNYYQRSLKIREDLGDRKGIAESLNSIGSIYEYFRVDHTKALEYLKKSLEIQTDLRNKQGIAMVLNNIGKIFFRKGDFHEAETYITRSLNIAKEVGYPLEISQASRTLSDMYAAQGKYKSAYEMYVLFKLMSDSVSNDETRKSVVRQLMQYEYEKKEAVMKAEQEKKDGIAIAEIGKQKVIRNSIVGGTAIIILFSIFSFIFYKRKRDAEVKQKETLFNLQVSETEMKALLSQMNPHFIKNSLNSIDDYIQDNDKDNSSRYLNRFSRLMGKILENSREKQISLKEDLEALELYIQLENLRMENKVVNTMDVSPEINTEEILIQPMLMQPFVENAFKHAFNKVENPKLEIKVSMKDEMIHCIVEDNGKGREPRDEGVHESKDKIESLGVKVTQERLDIINKIKKSKAYLAFEDLKDVNQKSVGTKVELVVPASFAF
ncbi:MAG TPA: tetratricopeptide repeat protein [Chitinophagales bacterium]|nr:tetratricopeptide repeat protein [Chitinophagales bacterium]